MSAWFGKNVKRVVLRGCVYVGGAVYSARGLASYEGVAAEIDMRGKRPVARVNGEAFVLRARG